MVKSVLGGMVTGGLVSAIGIATASLLAEQPAGSAPPAVPQIESPRGVTAQPPEADLDPAAAPAPSTAPEGAAPAAPVTPVETAPPLAQTSAGPAPDAGPASAEIAPVAEDAPAMRPGADTQVLPSPQTRAPDMPLPDQDIAVSTDPAQPIAPDDGEEGFIQIAPVIDGAEAPMADASPSPEAPSEVHDPPASTFAPVAPLGSSATDLFKDDAPVEAAPDLINALEAFSAEAPDPGDKPLFSVVMIDDARIGLGPDAVSSLAFPVTVALLASTPDVGARMAAYRAVGIETVAIADLPDSSDPADQQVALEAIFSTLPETIALLDSGALGLGNNRVAIAEALSRLAAEGRGLVTVSNGLETALRAAAKDGVPAVAIYRDLDNEGQSAQVIRRFLDQAAFKAGTEGQVVVLARLRPDTLSALDLWSNARRAQAVAPVPISAILKGGTE